MTGNGSARRAIATHPTLFGALLGLLLLTILTVLVVWFPATVQFHDNHKRLVQAIFFTAIFFVAYIYGLRRWRRLGIFWPTICILFALHVLAVFFYSTRVQAILVWQWPIVGLTEYYGATLFLEKLPRK
jgi:hypothetical protein